MLDGLWAVAIARPIPRRERSLARRNPCATCFLLGVPDFCFPDAAQPMQPVRRSGVHFAETSGDLIASHMPLIRGESCSIEAAIRAQHTLKEGWSCQ